jgi:Tfp pilus assembly protein PilE
MPLLIIALPSIKSSYHQARFQQTQADILKVNINIENQVQKQYSRMFEYSAYPLSPSDPSGFPGTTRLAHRQTLVITVTLKHHNRHSFKV